MNDREATEWSEIKKKKSLSVFRRLEAASGIRVATVDFIVLFVLVFFFYHEK